ncbi:hypothetical protein A3712_06950 [Vibrio sp. HI00D65]|uniref:CDP-alcohol phosphatidyltransferase family protein n=1 Tax=Vibrio sp. HI00D65 TaxID=1822216 RepID=UPI0007BA56C3|nr:CDP-alcohol phosphatidyltransferase family protein [Vibrio sp. HI00D65]KZX55612.1 hypothetical protein A3712_06950 [Vibrio sp. HI00D65]
MNIIAFAREYPKFKSVVSCKSTGLLYQNLAMPFTYLFFVLRLSPNLITFFSLISFILGAFFFIKESFIFCAGFWVLSYVLDCADGALARASNKQSSFGGFLDVSIDRLINLIFLAIVSSWASFQSYTSIELFVIILGCGLITFNALLSTTRVLYFPELKGYGRRENTSLLISFSKLVYELLETGNLYIIVCLSFYFNYEVEVLLLYSGVVFPLVIFNFFIAYKAGVERDNGKR